MDRYFKPTAQQRSELEIKRSRFITTIIPVLDKRSGLLAIDVIRQEFPDANHHCWAMIAAAPDDVYHQDQSDDGEPKGTAGKPMLNVLSHSGLGNVVVVVTRYFGGIKLGAGGLVRAYTAAVTTALSQLATDIQFVRDNRQMLLPYSQLDTLQHWLKTTNIAITDKEFT
ncbi:MAG: putative YigZ family protein, partial [bacterium]